MDEIIYKILDIKNKFKLERGENIELQRTHEIRETKTRDDATTIC